jgi:hypothetical protein
MGRPVDSRGVPVGFNASQLQNSLPFSVFIVPCYTGTAKKRTGFKKVNRTSKHDKAKLKNRQGAAKVLQDDLSTHKILFFILIPFLFLKKA